MEHRLGIVLSGGGSRGLAHVGALAALAERGIVPDCIAGASAGAIVGALAAAGYDRDDMVRFFDEANPFRISKFALGKPGLIDSEKIVGEFRRWFPDDSFAALGRRLFVTATDLDSGRGDVFSSGDLILPLLASSSVPLVFSPTVIDGRRYADGGIVDNFPVEPLVGLCDVIVGVYATPLRELDSRGLATSLAVSQRALEIGMFHASRRKFHQVGVLISPPELRRYATFDTRRHREIVEIGYGATVERLDEIEALLASVPRR
jgi:NTE family protein